MKNGGSVALKIVLIRSNPFLQICCRDSVQLILKGFKRVFIGDLLNSFQDHDDDERYLFGERACEELANAAQYTQNTLNCRLVVTFLKKLIDRQSAFNQVT